MEDERRRRSLDLEWQPERLKPRAGGIPREKKPAQESLAQESFAQGSFKKQERFAAEEIFAQESAAQELGSPVWIAPARSDWAGLPPQFLSTIFDS